MMMWRSNCDVVHNSKDTELWCSVPATQANLEAAVVQEAAAAESMCCCTREYFSARWQKGEGRAVLVLCGSHDSSRLSSAGHLGGYSVELIATVSLPMAGRCLAR